MLDRRSLLAGLGAAAAAPALARAQVAPGVAVRGLPPARPETVGCSAAGLGRINAVMADFIARNQITGGVTAVARRNRLVHFQAHGALDHAAKTPMRPDAIFVMMSSTKPVTGVALLQQLERGRLKLDDPITRYVPELTGFRVAKPGVPRPPRGQTYTADQLEPQQAEITLRHLANHTSGLNSGVQRQPGDTLATYIPRLKDTVLEFQPGSRWGYSGASGGDVLARVIELTSGQSYDRYLKQHIFDPVGMVDTTHNLTPEQETRFVRRYVQQNGAWVAPQGGNAPPRRTGYFAGAYGLMSTAHDYLLFESMLLNKGTIHGRRVLQPESVELMRTNMVGDMYRGTTGGTKGTGFGVMVRVVLDSPNSGSFRSNGAFGWGGAYGTVSWTDPADELVAVLMIQQPVFPLQYEFERAVRQAIV
jgi:CubicO group peptidase (beta-lactamase class C family)